MRFLADENFPGDAVTSLRTSGQDVLWIRTDAPGITDQDVLARGRRGSTYQDELTRRSNKEASDANKKAEEAQLARVTLEAQLAPRSLTKDHYDALQTLRGWFRQATW